jgi:hypothetical protein
MCGLKTSSSKRFLYAAVPRVQRNAIIIRRGLAVPLGADPQSIPFRSLARPAGVSPVSAQLPSTSNRQTFFKSPLDDHRELVKLSSRQVSEFFLFNVDIGLLGVALRANRDVLTDGHRTSCSRKPGNTGDHDGLF